MNYVYYPDYLEHHGIKGQKWGVRRFQDPNGTWTEEGLARRRKGGSKKLKSTAQLFKDYPTYVPREKVKESFDNWNVGEDSPYYDKNVKSYQRLQKKIENDSYDWYNSKPKSEEDYLIHHGVKGMKWGVRRYQEKDGTWTKAGLDHRRAKGSPYKYKASLKEKDRRFNEDLESADEDTFDSDYNLIKTAHYENKIKKGTPVYRYSSELNEKEDSRKYASITQGGASYYNDIGSSHLFTNPEWKEGKNVDSGDYEYRYEATKDLKVVPIKEMKEYALEKYNKDFVDSGKGFFKKKTKELSEWELHSRLREYIDNSDYRKANDFVDHFSKLGYDVMPDYVDLGNYDNMSGAMIFLKPYESLKLTDVYDTNYGNFNYDSYKNKGIENARNLNKLDKYKVR